MIQVVKAGKSQLVNEGTLPYWKTLGWSVDVDQDGNPDTYASLASPALTGAPTVNGVAFGNSVTPLAHWKAVRGLSASRTVKCLFIGDSVTEGTAVTTRTDRWQDVLMGTLRSTYPSGATGGEGYVPSVYISGTVAARVTYTGTTTTLVYVNDNGTITSGNKFGPGIRGIRLSAAATATLVFTGTGIDIICARGGNAGSLTYTIDGGAASAAYSAVQTAATSSGMVIPVRGLTAGSHTIVVTASDNYTYLEGFFVYNGNEAKGWQQWDAGHSGYRAVDFAGDRINFDTYGLIQPDLVTIALGLNEYGSPTAGTPMPPHAMRRWLTELVRGVRQQCVTPPSIVLHIPYKRGGTGFVVPAGYTWADYAAVYAQVASAVNGDIAVCDMQPVIGDLSAGNANGYGYTDLLHLTTAGMAQYASGYASFLTAA